MNEEIFSYLQKCLLHCNITINSLEQLNGMILPRDFFLDMENYEKIKKDITSLKKYLNSSYMTSLQSTAADKQRWPLLNLVRQLLRTCKYNMTPKRISDGYTVDGKKKYKRVFIIEKLKTIDEDVLPL